MSGQTYLSDQSMAAHRVNQDFEPDADLGRHPWNSITHIVIESSNEPPTTYPQARTEVASVWSPLAVYFAFRCRYTELHVFEDEDPAVEKWELWNRDVVEVFINPFPERIDKYWEFEVSPRNQWIDLAIDLGRDPFFDATWDSGFQHATRIDQAHQFWFCEMKIPAAAFGLDRIREGMEWRINFYRCDGPGDDTVRRFLAWCPTCETSFHVPRRFGRIRFVGPAAQGGCPGTARG